MNPQKSPFPGMDPFLEEPTRWSSVHFRLISIMSEVLANLVAPHFYVDVEQRVYIIDPDSGYQRQIVPDVYIVESTDSGGFYAGNEC